jgi:Flp pilus assembly pilin Flp
MSDVILRSSVRTQVTVHRLVDGLAAYGARVAKRSRREQTGQDILEYAGMLALVALIIAAVIAVHIPTKVGDAVSSAVTSILGGGGGGGGTTTTP